MKDSWKLGRLCGIDIFLHWSFLIVPAWVALTSLAAGATLASAVSAILFILAVFACVLLHEMGHALAARRYGIATRDITLLPIGGLAQLEGMPKRPLHEIVIALAGPAVNIVIAGVLACGLLLAQTLATPLPYAMVIASFALNLLYVNVGLAVFNLLPAFPMDGGRVFRALLAMAMPYTRATWTAAIVGQFLAVGMALLGLLTASVNLLFVALFAFLAARREARDVDVEEAYENPLEKSSMPSAKEFASFVVLPAHARADEVTRALFAQQNYFPVAQGGQMVGVVSKGRLLWAVANAHGDHLVAELMNQSSHFRPAVAFATLRTGL